ncbi:AsmA family protein [Parvularcula sp. LCG005]|uniref:AsmA family protein n=1 Tax=Parvularcula sp. LCG005 TaxID=3078805 RepID=UPI002943579F|nr:AsmA family protein [Parvularcula sp. LCG005]WOI52027.1 AsmA family protein [Parvularcula sp. LCG005]
MRRLLIILAGVVVLLVALVFLLPVFIPADKLEAQVEAKASAALGREVTIDGAPKISILPTKLTVRGLTVANAEGFSAPYLVKVDEARIGVKLFPLFSSRVEITQFDLDSPDVNLQSDAAGNANWMLGSGESAPAEESDGSGLNDVQLGTININNGRIAYDGGTGETYQAENADIQITMESLDEPLSIDGTMDVQGEASSVKAIFTTPRQFTDQGEATLDLDMKLGPNTVDTRLNLSDTLAFNGDLDVDVPALRALMQLVGASIDTDNGFEKLRLKGPVQGTSEKVLFGTGTELTFDDIKGTGSVSIDLAGERPAVTGELTVGTLDLTPYLPAEPEGMKDAKEGGAFPEWSTEPMDFSALTAIDAQLSFIADQIILPSVQVDNSQLRVKLQNGNLLANIDQMVLYGGTGTGTMTANFAATRPSLGAKFNLTDVNVGTLAKELLAVSRLNATGGVNIDVKTQGRSQAEWVNNLSGTLTTDLADGQIQGFNLGKVARSAMQAYTSLRDGGLNAATLTSTFANIGSTARGPAEETDFSDLLVDVGIANGIVTSKTLRLVGPYFEVAGDAVINLPAQSVEMRLTPTVSAVDGEALRALPVPIQISGSFNSPKVGVDAAPLIKGVASGQVKQLLNKGGIGVGEDETVEDALRNKGREELGRLLGGKKETVEDGDTVDEATGEDADPDAAAEDTEAEADEKSAKDELIEQGLNSLFGNKKKTN